MKNKKILILLGFLIFAVIVAVILFFGRKEKEKVPIVGFILSGGVEEEGWNGVHYQGIKEACEKLDVKLLVEENVLEFTGECEKAIHRLAEKGASMIILSSYGYSEEVIDIVKEYPDIAFYTNSSEYHASNMTSYFVRMYQARYLAGIVAGKQTESGKIGYVAAMPNNEVNRGINAFTLGVRRHNPDAVVEVIWTGEWDNEEKEREAVRTLVEESGVDVITYHQNQTTVIEEAEKLGVDSIGYHLQVEDASEHYLTSVVCDWAIVYEKIVHQFLQGKGNVTDNFWIGMGEGAVDLSHYSSRVSEQTIQEIENAKEKIIKTNEIFAGEIYDINGEKRCGENEVISDKVLLEQFDWYVEGVEFYEG